MNMPIIVPATKEHAASIATRMRAEDAAELTASMGLPIDEAMLICLNNSTSAWTWMIDGEAACMFGYAAQNMIGNKAFP